jgi:hypothetical protein
VNWQGKEVKYVAASCSRMPHVSRPSKRGIPRTHPSWAFGKNGDRQTFNLLQTAIRKTGNVPSVPGFPENVTRGIGFCRPLYLVLLSINSSNPTEIAGVHR